MKIVSLEIANYLNYNTLIVPSKTYLSFIVLAIIFSCGNQKNIDIPTEVEITETNPRIAFINYAFQKSKDGNLQVTLINKIIKEGALKKNTNPVMEETELYILQLDDINNPLIKTYLENPSSKMVEYVNDNGELGQKKIELNNGEFSIRTQLAPRTKSIAMFISNKQNTSSKLLITTKIENP